MLTTLVELVGITNMFFVIKSNPNIVINIIVKQCICHEHKTIVCVEINHHSSCEHGQIPPLVFTTVIYSRRNSCFKTWNFPKARIDNDCLSAAINTFNCAESN